MYKKKNEEKYVFKELDQWLYDIEWKFKTQKTLNPRDFAKLGALKIMRDVYYYKYKCNIKKVCGRGYGAKLVSKYCRERVLDHYKREVV